MKKYILTLLFTISLLFGKAQSDVELYCSIIMKPSFYDFKKGQPIGVDYGKGTKEAERELLKDTTGKELRFFSTIHVVNYMSTIGWVLVSVSPTSSDQYTAFGKTSIDTERSLFIFKRKVIQNKIDN